MLSVFQNLVGPKQLASPMDGAPVLGFCEILKLGNIYIWKLQNVKFEKEKQIIKNNFKYVHVFFDLFTILDFGCENIREGCFNIVLYCSK